MHSQVINKIEEHSKSEQENQTSFESQITAEGVGDEQTKNDRPASFWNSAAAKREYFYSYKNRRQIQRGRKTRKILTWKESFPTPSSGVMLQIQDYRDLKLDTEKQKLTKSYHQSITALLFTLPQAICNKALGQLPVILTEILKNYFTTKTLMVRSLQKEITKTCYKENVFLSSHVLVSVSDEGTQFSLNDTKFRN